MFANITRLLFWKTEHNEQSCEDALADDPSAGIFAVADGVGTAIFSDVWARIMVNHFLTLPLLSADPFEVEWWVRPAQTEYKRKTPDPATLDYNAQRKAREDGAYSTLATARITRVDETSASAQLLVFGDSCVMVRKASSEKIQSFVLKEPAEFARGPVCIPALLRNLDRDFHGCHVQAIELEPDDTVILATDAVARWILNGGSAVEGTPEAAFEKVAAQTEKSWPGFIIDCRAREEMVDDDSTALILTLRKERGDGNVQLGATTDHPRQACEQRRRDFEQAKAADDKELMAICFGDGRDLGYTGAQLPADIEHARDVAYALKELRFKFRAEVNSPDLIAKLRPVWEQYQGLLENEVCAQSIIASLHQRGVIQPGAPVSPQPSSPMTPLPQPESNAAGGPSATPIARPGSAAEQQPVSPEVERLREKAKRTFQNALQSGDHWEILKNYNPDLLNPVITTRERAQLAEALVRASEESRIRSYYTDERECLNLMRQFLEALHSDDDQVILSAFKKIQNADDPEKIMRFTRAEQERINLAARRNALLVTLRSVLGRGGAREMVEQMDKQPEVNQKRLTPQEREQLDLALAFVEACNRDDDALLSAYQSIQASPYRDQFAFSTEEDRRISRAQEYKDSRILLHDALQSGRIERIAWASWSDSSFKKKLTEQERTACELAVFFTEALTSPEQDEKLLATYEQMTRPEYEPFFRFTEDEEQHVLAARQRQEERNKDQRVVAQIDGSDITVEMADKLIWLRDWYTDFRIRQLGEVARNNPEMRAQTNEEIMDIQAFNRADRDDYVLYSSLIHREMERQQEDSRRKGNKAPFPDQYSSLLDVTREFQRHLEAHYADVIAQRRVTPDDIQKAMSAFMRQRAFARYWRDQRKGDLIGWLEKQKREQEANAAHTESGELEDSSGKKKSWWPF